jgi:small subunit ribosomal protein S3Ae
VRKAKAKEWFSIVAPKYLNEKEIGKTITSDPKTLINRRIIVSAVDLTNDLSKYYLKVGLRINKIEGNKALTEFDSSECLRDYISRMVVRRVRRVDTVQDLITKDGKKIRVKGIAIIPRRVKSSIQKKVRAKIVELIKAEVENSTLEEFVKKIFSEEIKNKILKEVGKIYPLRNFEIRKTEILP